MREEKKEELKTVEDEHRKFHVIKNKIEKDILNKYNVKLSSFHGGYLAKHLIRRLMRGGDTIFLEI